jgi:hypothetical protein
MPERDAAEVASLAARNARLERMTRRLVAFGLLLTGFFAGWTASGAAAVGKPPKAVEANAFVLLDVNGKMRGQLSIDEDGNGRLVLYGSDGRVRFELPSQPRVFPATR